MKIGNYAAVAAAVAIYLSPALVTAQDNEDEHHQIDQIVVTSAPLGRTVEELAQPVSVLYGDDLAKKQSTSIGETLSQEPGLSSTYFGPVSSRPVIRGQFGERVRVLSNGLDSLDAVVDVLALEVVERSVGDDLAGRRHLRCVTAEQRDLDLARIDRTFDDDARIPASRELERRAEPGRIRHA